MHSVLTKVPLLNQQQKTAYDTMMITVNAGYGGIFFLEAPGGTSKTFIISLILALIRNNESTTKNYYLGCVYDGAQVSIEGVRSNVERIAH